MAYDIIYARQSIERQDSVSIEAQIEQCRKFAKNEIKIYQDAGFSGKNIQRPEFEKLLKDVKSGDVETIISYRLDRISRNIIDFANLLNLFEANKVKYISATEQFDTTTPMGKAMIYIVMVFAQLERETIATRISDNYRYRAKQGLFMGGNVPFGYTSKPILIEGKKSSMLEPNENAETLKRIFSMFDSEDSINNIVKTLNREGLRTAKGNLWTANGIARILKNVSPCQADQQLYDYLDAMGYTILNNRDDFTGEYGTCIFFKNKNKHEATDVSEQLALIGLHKPLLTSSEFIKVQTIINSKYKPQRSKRSQKTFLAGILSCGECKHSFGLKSTNKNNKNYSYYYCRGRLNRFVCTNDLYIEADKLEKDIVNQCIKHLNEYSVDKIVADNNQVISNENEIFLINQQIENLVNNIGKGNSIVDDLLTKKITELQNKMNEIKLEKVNINVNIDTTNFIEGLRERFNNFDNLDINEKSTLIRQVINRIYIYKDGTIEITYPF